MAKESERSISKRDLFRLIPPFLTGLAGGAVLGDRVTRYNIWEHPLPVPDPNAHRFLIFGDIHAGDIDNGPRQNNTKSLETLESVLEHLKDYPIDYGMQMGDLIRQQGSENQNVANYKKALHLFQKLPYPTAHLPGNHDVWGISPAGLAEIAQENGIDSFYGFKKFNNFQIVWLDMVALKEHPRTLPVERIDWLKNIIGETPTFIFTHYPLIPQDTEGNYYFDRSPSLTSLTNYQDVWESLKGLPVAAVISAHMHWISHSQVQETQMITVPAFVENMLSSDQSENPGVYSILEIDYPKKFMLRSYFGSICFSQIQLNLYSDSPR